MSYETIKYFLDKKKNHQKSLINELIEIKNTLDTYKVSIANDNLMRDVFYLNKNKSLIVIIPADYVFYYYLKLEENSNSGFFELKDGFSYFRNVSFN